jgi:hypothetical protein
VSWAFKETGAAGREALPVSSRRRGAEDASGSRRRSGAPQVFSGELPRARRLLQPFLPCVVPASGQTTPLTSRTCWPAAQSRRAAQRIARRAMVGPHRFDECPRRATPGAVDRRCGRCRIARRLFEGAGGTLGSEKRPHRVEGRAVSRAQQAVLPALDHRSRKDMRQTPADEVLRTESAALGWLGVGILVLEGDLAIF